MIPSPPHHSCYLPGFLFPLVQNPLHIFKFWPLPTSWVSHGVSFLTPAHQDPATLGCPRPSGKVSYLGRLVKPPPPRSSDSPDTLCHKSSSFKQMSPRWLQVLFVMEGCCVPLSRAKPCKGRGHACSVYNSLSTRDQGTDSFPLMFRILGEP